MKFGEGVLKHATGHSKLSEVALVCLLDMCRAATYVKEEGEVPLRMVAFDIAHEIKVYVVTPLIFWSSFDIFPL
jgi:neurofibromin 1